MRTPITILNGQIEGMADGIFIARRRHVRLPHRRSHPAAAPHGRPLQPVPVEEGAFILRRSLTDVTALAGDHSRTAAPPVRRRPGDPRRGPGHAGRRPLCDADRSPRCWSTCWATHCAPAIPAARVSVTVAPATARPRMPDHRPGRRHRRRRTRSRSASSPLRTPRASSAARRRRRQRHRPDHRPRHRPRPRRRHHRRLPGPGPGSNLHCPPATGAAGRLTGQLQMETWTGGRKRARGMPSAGVRMTWVAAGVVRKVRNVPAAADRVSGSRAVAYQ